jgi:hypothetical protein
VTQAGRLAAVRHDLHRARTLALDVVGGPARGRWVFSIPVGILTDRTTRTRLLAGSIAAWAAATALTVVIGGGAVAGVYTGGRVADRLLRRGHIRARVLVPAVCLLALTPVLAPAIATTALAVALPLLLVGGFLLGAVNPPLDAARLDIIHPQLWGRAEGVRTPTPATWPPPPRPFRPSTMRKTPAPGRLPRDAHLTSRSAIAAQFRRRRSRTGPGTAQ